MIFIFFAIFLIMNTSLNPQARPALYKYIMHKDTTPEFLTKFAGLKIFHFYLPPFVQKWYFSPYNLI